MGISYFQHSASILVAGIETVLAIIPGLGKTIINLRESVKFVRHTQKATYTEKFTNPETQYMVQFKGKNWFSAIYYRYTHTETLVYAHPTINDMC